MASSIAKKIEIPEIQRGRRRRFSEDEKRTLLMEAFLNRESLSEVSRRYGIAVGLLFRWQKNLGITRMSVCGESSATVREPSPAERRLAELELQLTSLLHDNRVLHNRLARIESVSEGAMTSSAAIHAS
jgi:transposase-like protein